ncbi:MAG: acyl carrier protein [Pseudomonadota bacterium]
MRTESEIFESLRGILIELFEIEPAKIRLEARFFEDLDIDSIDVIDLLLKLNEVTGKKIQAEQFKHVRSVGDVVSALATLLNGPHERAA